MSTPQVASVMEVYLDPDANNEMLIILASLPGGVTNVEFSLVGSGSGTFTVRVTYNWPKISFNMEEVFAKKIAFGIPSCHPKIVALKNGLKATRSCINEIPRGYIELTLPIAVLTNTNSIFRSARKKEDGSMLLIVESTANQTAYTVKKENTKIIFEDL